MLAALALSAAACSSDEVNGLDNSPVEAKITAGLAGAQSRAVDVTWNKDEIGVMVTDAPTSEMENMYKNVKYSTSSTSTSATFTAEIDKGIFFQDASEQVTFAAYAPYQASDANVLPGTSGAIPVNTADNNTKEKQENIDFLYASGVTASKSSPTVAFSDVNAFQHKMAKLVLVVKVSTKDGFLATDINKISSVILGGLKHEGTFNVTNGTASVTEEATTNDNWEIKDCKSTTASPGTSNYGTRTYTLILLPQNNLTTLPLSITVANKTYQASLSINGNTLQAGTFYTCTVTVKKAEAKVNASTIESWSEGGSTSSDATT